MNSTNGVTGASPPPPGVTPNFTDPESIGYQIIFTAVICPIFTILRCLLPLYTSHRIVKRFHLDNSKETSLSMPQHAACQADQKRPVFIAIALVWHSLALHSYHDTANRCSTARYSLQQIPSSDSCIRTPEKQCRVCFAGLTLHLFPRAGKCSRAAHVGMSLSPISRCSSRFEADSPCAVAAGEHRRIAHIEPLRQSSSKSPSYNSAFPRAGPSESPYTSSCSSL
jgi:hypothetical protein